MEVQALLLDLVRSARAMKLTEKQLRVLVKRQFIIDVLTDSRFNQVRAAVELGMHRNTLSRELDLLGIDVRSLKKKPAVRAMGVVGQQVSIAN